MYGTHFEECKRIKKMNTVNVKCSSKDLITNRLLRIKKIHACIKCQLPSRNKKSSKLTKTLIDKKKVIL